MGGIYKQLISTN